MGSVLEGFETVPGHWFHYECPVYPFDFGYADGYENPEDLTTGMTWHDSKQNEEYDRGVNAGQRARARDLGIIAQADREGYPQCS